MASPSYDEILKDLYNQLYEKLERRDIADKRFAGVGTTEEVLSPFNLRRFFCSLVPPGDPLEDYFGSDITADVLISRTEERSLQTFLATLIYARCSVESARGFVTKLLTSFEWAEVDQLPAGRRQLEQVFGIENGPDVNSFMDAQSCFCPIVLYEGEDVQVPNGVNQRLPYVSDQEYIDTGSYGIVYRVEIAKGHLRNRVTTTANTNVVKMARKDFKKVHDLNQEHEIIKHIRDAPRKSKNIVETFCSLQLDENIFSLFMPCAECDLRLWMRNTPHPILESEKADILRCASGLADGLEFLHSGIQDPNGNNMVCYHMDLKPANILVFLDDRERGRKIWKISDFGMSRVKIPHRSATTNERDITAPFEKRGGETSPSGTVNRRFDSTYLAPESIVSMRIMNVKSDVWSLGCIISVVFAYIEEGQDGIDKYRAEREIPHPYDRFFLAGRRPTQPKPHPAVKKYHNWLIAKANGRSSSEGRLMADVLKYIEEKALQLEPKERVSAGSIRDKLYSVSAKFSEISEGRESCNPSGVSSNMASRWWQKPFHRQKLDGAKVESWEIYDMQSPIGCSIAPNEFTLAYWTSTRISLYDSQSFLPFSGKRISRVAEYKLRGTRSLKSVKLTDRYLLASTTGHHSHIPNVLLFDIKLGRLPGLNFDQSYEIELPVDNHNGLYQIAISPGSKVIACVVHQDAGKSWVFYADIDNLLTHGIRRRDSETTLSSNGGLQYRITAKEQWDWFTVDASAGSVTHLLFASDTTLCCVAQPDMTEGHEPHITCLSLPTRSVKKYYLDKSSDVEYDSGNWGRLFTALTAIDSEQTLAIVLYEKQLVIRNFINPSPRFKSQTTLRNYFIVELLMDEQRSRLYALGSKSGRGRLLLIELPLNGLSHGEKPQEITRFPKIGHRDKFTARIFRDTDAEGYIVISVYAGAQPMLYKINLPSP
ncbi:kinase-like protein [Hypoxylon cercidicola]|nr:kinase-like protein [Hypoxylon cercidicola]